MTDIVERLRSSRSAQGQYSKITQDDLDEAADEITVMRKRCENVCRKNGDQREEIERLHRCTAMAIGCLNPESVNLDERLAWYRLLDAKEGREPRASHTTGE